MQDVCKKCESRIAGLESYMRDVIACSKIVQDENAKLEKRIKDLENEIAVMKKPAIKWSYDSVYYTYDGLRFKLPDKKQMYVPDWNLLTESQQDVMALKISCSIDDILCELDISSVLRKKILVPTLYNISKYFVNMMADIGRLNAIQDLLSIKWKGILYMVNKTLFPNASLL